MMHGQYGGIVPELASRAHERLLAPAVESVLRETGLKSTDINGVAVTYGPGLAGALLVGVAFAKGMASSLSIPLIGVNHLEGHLWSFKLTETDSPLPFLSLIVSGGHTLLVKVNGFGDYVRLGGTRDDAAGELFDKVGRMLGFGFPAGAAMDSAACSFEGEPVVFPRVKLKDDPYGFSFSGLKTAVLYHLQKNYQRNEAGFILPDQERSAICKGLMESVSDMLADRIAYAVKSDTYHAVVVSGGVSASRFIRQRISSIAKKHQIPMLVPPVHHCTDNGAMIANVGYEHFKRQKFDSLELPINPGLSLFTSPVDPVN